MAAFERPSAFSAQIGSAFLLHRTVTLLSGGRRRWTKTSGHRRSSSVAFFVKTQLIQ